MSNIIGDLMRPYLRDVFPFILDAINVANKVITQIIDQCILHIISKVNFKSTSMLTLLSSEVKDNKAKYVRERCLAYMNEILLLWSLNDKDLNIYCDMLKNYAFSDASPGAREISKKIYTNLYIHFPLKAEKLRNELNSNNLQLKLIKIEEDIKQNNRQLHSSSAPSLVVSTTSSSQESFSQTAPPNLSYNSTDSLNLSPTKPINLSSTFQSPSKNPIFTPSRIGNEKNKEGTSIHSPNKSINKSTPNKKDFSTPTKTKNNKTTTNSNISSSTATSLFTPLKNNSSTPLNNTSNGITSSNTVDTLENKAAIAIQNTFRNRRRSVIQNPFASLLPLDPDSVSPLRLTSKYNDEQVEELHKTILLENGNNGSLLLTTSETISTGFNSLNSTSSSVSKDFQSNTTSITNNNAQKSPQNTKITSNNNSTSSPSQIDLYPKKLSLGMKVYVKMNGNNEAGFIRYIGHTDFASGIWIGLELLKPKGKNNGTVQGKYYFKAENNYGLFVKEEYIVLDTFQSNTTTTESSNNSLTNHTNHLYEENPNDLSSILTQSTIETSFHQIKKDYPPEASSPMRLEMDSEDEDLIQSPPKKKNSEGVSYQTPLNFKKNLLNHYDDLDEFNKDNLNELNNKNEVGKKRKSSSHILLQLSELMNLLGKQIEIVTILEKEEKKDITNKNSINSLRKEIEIISTQEISLIHKLQDFLKQLD